MEDLAPLLSASALIHNGLAGFSCFVLFCLTERPHTVRAGQRLAKYGDSRFIANGCIHLDWCLVDLLVMPALSKTFPCKPFRVQPVFQKVHPLRSEDR
jgi:hypothetical protein